MYVSTMVAFCDICGTMVPPGETVPATMLTRRPGETDRTDLCADCAKTICDILAQMREENQKGAGR